MHSGSDCQVGITQLMNNWITESKGISYADDLHVLFGYDQEAI